jgi:hypothetical protein
MRTSLCGIVGAGLIITAAAGCQALAFKATRTTQHTAPAPLSGLIVEAKNGAIVVQGTDGNDLIVTATQTARGVTQQAADELLEQIQVRLEEQGEDVRVYADTPKSFNGSVAFEIQVPRGVQVPANTGNGGD